MTIQYLQKLRDNPARDNHTNRGLTEAEITALEQLYNNGGAFPKVLKELLFLAGEFCNVLDYNVYDSPQEMQDSTRLDMLQGEGITITRPHFYVDLVNFDVPLFIFLDEGDNPPLNQIEQNPTSSSYYRHTGGTLQSLIESRIQNYLDGYNPF